MDGWEKRIISDAANMPQGSNPAFAAADLYAFYPQFKGIIPDVVIEMYIGLASASLSAARWMGSWKIGMCMFVAHFLTLYLQTSTPEGATAVQVINAGEARGLTTSKSVGGVSQSIDYSTAAADLDGWAAWKLTAYGQQFATMAKLVGMGGAVIW
ncbi:DUF4054 domain-containing protein [Anaerotruncus sp. AF02-27]|uniref:DUF4054 domain-containing protein n=1 Tax=Anaerotruncus sp. AF02-27 TaxID=2292191 RepID=UPI000E4C1E0F|nr:DUF4054 domain-containing protein [Anaerotruncus sp. AF02-27]RGX53204.1 DUF4054 domain-containing protein [Anaerotruncus sp. AF02-27]